VIVTFPLPHAFTPGSSALENAKVLKAMMQALVATDEAYLEHHAAPKLYASRVVYGRTNEWEAIPAVLARGHADCKSLAAWRVAELRKEGQRADIVFRWRERPNGVRDYHILIVTPKGYEDPSKVLGMGANEWAHMNGATR
jgi:hypothetical protein